MKEILYELFGKFAEPLQQLLKDNGLVITTVINNDSAIATLNQIISQGRCTDIVCKKCPLVQTHTTCSYRASYEGMDFRTYVLYAAKAKLAELTSAPTRDNAHKHIMSDKTIPDIVQKETFKPIKSTLNARFVKWCKEYNYHPNRLESAIKLVEQNGNCKGLKCNSCFLYNPCKTIAERALIAERYVDIYNSDWS